MPVPASINDISTTAGNNSPAGSESPTTTDDYLRTLSAFIAWLRDNRQPLDPVLTALADQTVLGSTDAAAARATIAAMADADASFTIIYPNGGSAASPANVALNGRYVMTNPFPGHRVIAIPQLSIGGSWSDAGWGQDTNNHVGVRAGMTGDSVVVQTGRDGISWQGGITGESKPLSTELITTAPCRVTVFKIKGALA